MSVIQAAWKAEVGGSWSKRVEKTVRHYLKKIIKAKKGWGHCSSGKALAYSKHNT
jgi:hypothetical protein